MSAVEITSLSSKGKMVIPNVIRKDLDIYEQGINLPLFFLTEKTFFSDQLKNLKSIDSRAYSRESEISTGSSAHKRNVEKS